MKKLIDSKNSRLSCFGDSITDHGWWPIEAMHTLNKFSKLNLSVFNCGVGGDTMHGSLRRFSWDLLPQKPDYVFICFGANDTNYPQYKINTDLLSRVISDRPDTIHRYTESLKKHISVLREHNITPIVGTPTRFCCEELNSNFEYDFIKVNETISMLADSARKVANEYDCELVDFNAMMALAVSNWKGKVIGELYQSDRIHMVQTGYRVLGLCFAKAFNDEIVIPTSLAELTKLYGELSKNEIEKHRLENTLRCAAVFYYGAQINGWTELPEDEMLEKGFEEFYNTDSSDWRKKTIRDYAIWRNNMPELFAKIDAITEKCLANNT